MKSRIRVLPDGREITSGYQWEKRKKEIWERAAGFCEGHLIELEHPRHVLYEGDVHHIRPRSKGRDDRAENLVYICRWLHSNIDPRKVRWTKKERDDA